MGLVCLFPLDDATGTTGRELLGGAGLVLGSLEFPTDAVAGPASDPRISQGLLFDGANDKAFSYDFMSGDHPNSFSLVARIKPTAVSGDTTGVNYRVLSYQSGSTGHACIGIDNSKLAIFIRSGGTGTEYHGATTLVVGTEYHIALVVDHVGGTVKAYLDGVEEISQTVAVDNVVATTPLGVGCGLSSATPSAGTPSHFTRWFAGTIWEPQAYDHALSPGEVEALANNQFTWHLVTRPGRWVFGWQSLRTDTGNVALFAEIDAVAKLDLPAYALGHNYDNANGYTNVGYGVPFNVPASDVGSYIVANVLGDDVSNVQMVEPELDFEICEQWGCHQHSAPAGVWFNGDFVQAVFSPGEPGCYLRINGEILLDESDEPLSIMADAAEVEVIDTYHRACSLHTMAAGIVALATDHQSRIYLRAAATAAELPDATTVLVSVNNGAFASTYCQVTNGYDVDSLAFAYRAVDQYHLRLVEPFAADPQATLVLDVICDNGTDTHRPYPRELTKLDDDNGAPVLFWAFQDRNDNDVSWGAIACGIRESDGQIYNLRGQAVGGTTNGTTSTPKLTNAQAYATVYTTANVCQILEAVTSANRYAAQFVLPRLTGWSSASRSADAVIVFADTTNIDNAAAEGLQVRLCFYDGSTATRYLTPAASDPFDLDGGNSYRLSAYGWWRDGNPQTGIVDLVIGLATTLPSENGGYYGFGSQRSFVRYEVNLNNVASDADLLAGIKRLYAIDSQCEHYATLQRTNIASRFIVDRSRVSIHDTLRIGSTLNGVIDLTGTKP